MSGSDFSKFIFIIIFIFCIPLSSKALDSRKFAIVDSHNAKIYSSISKTSPFSGRLHKGDVLYSEKEFVGFGNSILMTSANKKTGYVKGRALRNFNTDGVYYINFLKGIIRNIKGISSDSHIKMAGKDSFVILNFKGGKLFKYNIKTGKTKELYSGDRHSIHNKILQVSPDGRFVFFRTGGLSGDEISTRVVDSKNLDSIVFRHLNEIPVHFSKNSERILYGPDQYNSNIYVFTPETLISNLIDLRERFKENRTQAYIKPVKVELSNSGDRMLVIEHDLQMKIYRVKDQFVLFEAKNVSDALFLDNGGVFFRRPEGYSLTDSNGNVIAGPVLPDATTDIPHLSPQERFVYFTSKVNKKERLRYIFDLKNNLMTTLTGLKNKTPILYNPVFLEDDSLIICNGHTVNPVNGIVVSHGFLENISDEYICSKGGYVIRYNRYHHMEILNTINGRVLYSFPFPRDFKPVFGSEPEYFLMKKDYEN